MDRSGVIPTFRGDYFFLSNYYPAPFEWRRHQFNSAEQAFAYAKTFFATGDGDAARDLVMRSEVPGDAKKVGRQISIRVDEWDAHKIMYMRQIVHAKFSGVRGLAGELINTGAKMLVEGNDWGDTFWGRSLDKSTGKMVGLNTLGVILMEERGYWLYSDFKENSDGRSQADF